tara:strand:+ start:746 stop:916 length:171 start_codon:yes stop_codon:yes gene_type:complete
MLNESELIFQGKKLWSHNGIRTSRLDNKKKKKYSRAVGLLKALLRFKNQISSDIIY